ncbi:membrane dipeptidase [Caulobacter segnis]
MFDHPRNVPDDLLKKLAEKGGVIQIDAFSSYMILPPPPNPERDKTMAALMAKFRLAQQADRGSGGQTDGRAARAPGSCT